MLGQLLSELKTDRASLEEIEVHQVNFLEANENLGQWLANVESVPHESVHTLLEEYSPAHTLYPRRAAWTTMVASGQLSLLGDNNLVSDLGNYYEYTVGRLVYNNEDYDQANYQLERDAIPNIWDFEQKQLISSDPERLAIFRGKLHNINNWTRWYLGFIKEYKTELDSLIQNIERYLESYQ